METCKDDYHVFDKDRNLITIPNYNSVEEFNSSKKPYYPLKEIHTWYDIFYDKQSKSYFHGGTLRKPGRDISYTVKECFTYGSGSYHREFHYKFPGGANNIVVPIVTIVSIPPLKRNNGDIVELNEFPLKYYTGYPGNDTKDYKYFLDRVKKYNENFYGIDNPYLKKITVTDDCILAFTIGVGNTIDGMPDCYGRPGERYPAGESLYTFKLINTAKRAYELFDYKDKKYASEYQILFNFINCSSIKTINNINKILLAVFNLHNAGNNVFPNIGVIPKFIPGVPGSDGTHPLDIPLEGHPIYIKAWTGIKQT